MGHLMCAGCFTHLLADGRLRDQVATCPNCRVEISKNNASRNLAVEKAVSELPSECQVITINSLQSPFRFHLFLLPLLIYHSFATKNFHARPWIITNAMNATNAQLNANTSSSVVNGMVRHTKQRSTSHLALIQRVIFKLMPKHCSTD